MQDGGGRHSEKIEKSPVWLIIIIPHFLFF